jgi:hypothetical protein
MWVIGSSVIQRVCFNASWAFNYVDRFPQPLVHQSSPSNTPHDATDSRHCRDKAVSIQGLNVAEDNKADGAFSIQICTSMSWNKWISSRRNERDDTVVGNTKFSSYVIILFNSPLCQEQWNVVKISPAAFTVLKGLFKLINLTDWLTPWSTTLLRRQQSSS